MRLRSRSGSYGMVLLILGAVSLREGCAASGADNAPAGTSPVVLDADPRAKWFAVFSPDGQTLAAGGDGAVLKFWEVGTWRERRTIQAPRDFLRCAAFTRDGKILAVGGHSGTLTLWDTASGKLMRDFREHTRVLRTINFTPDGKLMVTSGQDKKVAVWDTATWRVVRRLTDLPLAVLSTRVSPDGKLLAVALGNAEPPLDEGGPTVRLYDLATLTQRVELTGVNETVWGVAFSPDSKTLAAVGTGLIRLWNSTSGEAVAAIDPQYNLRVAAFSPDGKSLLTAGIAPRVPGAPPSGNGRVWDLATRRPRATLLAQGSLILDASFSPDGKLIATAALAAGDVRVWDVARLPEASASAIEAALNPNGSAGPAAGAGSSRPIASGPAAPPPTVLRVHDRAGWFVAYSPDGTQIATGGGAAVKILDSTTHAEKAVFPVPTDRVNCGAFAPDGTTLATGGYSKDPVVRLWDVATGKLRATLGEGNRFVFRVAFTPDGKILASSCGPSVVQLWDPVNADPLGSITVNAKGFIALACAPDGKTLAAGCAQGQIYLLDIPGRKVVATLEGHKEEVRGLAFSPDGTLLASGGRDRLVKLWDVSNLAEIATLKGHTGNLHCIQFAPDGKTLATSCDDGTIRLWDIVTRSEKRVLTGHINDAYSVAFAPDGRTLASTGVDGTVRLWDVRATPGTMGPK